MGVNLGRTERSRGSHRLIRITHRFSRALGRFRVKTPHSLYSRTPDVSSAGLRTLVTGFLDLSVAASTPPPEPPKPVVVAPPPPVPQPDRNRIYSMLDKDVTAPVVIRQQMPQLTPAMKLQAKTHGIVEVVIDEQGRVTNLVMRESVHPMFDALLLSAGREWRYQPATLMGQPVRYRKMIQINVSP